MIAERPQNARTARQITDFERQLGAPALRLAAHAALPVVLTPELLHLIRINFLQEAEERVPYATEAKLLLSSLCREIGGDLFEIDSDVRTTLLSVLERDHGEQRIREVAALLLQYTQEASPWFDRPQLERAQQLTALNFLEPLRAQEWLDAAEVGSTGTALDHQWFVAMRGEMIRGQERVTAVVSEPFDPVRLAEALTRLDFKAQLAMAGSMREVRTVSGQLRRLGPVLIHGPEHHGQRWVLDLVLRGQPPAEVLVLPISMSWLYQGVAGILGALLGRGTEMTYEATIKFVSTRLASHDIVLVFQGITKHFDGAMAKQFWDLWDELMAGLGGSLIERERAELRVFFLGVWDGSDIPSTLTGRPITILPRLEPFTESAVADWLIENQAALPPELTADVVPMARRIIAGSDGGIPESALRYIAELCLASWTEVEAAVRAESRWQPIAPGPSVSDEALQLADEYNGTRARMPSGPDRTRAMEAIVAKMRRVQPTPEVLPGLMASPSAGARLLAVVSLQQAPEKRHLSWLAERLREERPFVGYHAAVALERAAERLEESALPAIKEAIEVARVNLGQDRGLTDRWQAIDRAQTVLDDRRAAIADKAGKAEKRPARKRARRPASYQGPESEWKLWPAGTVLRVRFLDGNTITQDLVKRIAPQWTENTNLSFSFLSPGSTEPDDIRVSFAEPGTWSYLGTDASTVARSEPTVNLGDLTSTDEEVSRMILSSFGHAIGLVNEHQNPNADIHWDVDVMLRELGGPPNYWDETTIRNNILTRYRFKSPPVYRDFDPDSVMLFPFPKEWTRLAVDVGGGSTLSASDRQFVRSLYPPNEWSDTSNAFDESSAEVASSSSA